MTVDTNIVIAYLGGDELLIDLITTWRKQGGFLYLSTIAEAEVLSFSEWTPQECHATERFLAENFISVPFDRPVMRLAAEMRRTVKIKLPDAAIAATALFTHTPLLTRNYKDFRKIKKLRLITV